MNKISLTLLLCMLISLATKLYAKDTKSITLDTKKIEQLVGIKGQFDEKEKVFKINVPRDDLNVTINKVKITPPLGLSSWMAFKAIGDTTLVMGDLSLLQDQVNPVMSTALENGLHVTALHNHLLWETPRTMFMHIEGVGETDALAKAVGQVFEKVQSTSNEKFSLPDVTITPETSTIDASKMDSIIGVKGTLTKGVYKVIIGRKAKMEGYKIGNLMGINSWAAFMGSADQAIINGDIATQESEVQSVLKELRNSGLYVVSIHQHMLNENPRYIYIHFYGIGKAETLAKAFRRVLDII